MCADNADAPGGILGYQFFDNGGVAIIQAGGGFIQQDGGGIFHEGAGQGRALGLAAGKLIGPAVAQFGKPQVVNQSFAAGFPFLAGQHGHFCSQVQVAFHAHERQQVDALEHVGHVFSVVAAAGDTHSRGGDDAPAGHFEVTGQQLEQGGFAGTGISLEHRDAGFEDIAKFEQEIEDAGIVTDTVSPKLLPSYARK